MGSEGVEEVCVVGFGRPCDLYVYVTAAPSAATRKVRIVPSWFDRPGVLRVQLTSVHPSESVYVVNPEALPFNTKIRLLGVPPCPRCGGFLRGDEDSSSFGCDYCRVVLPRDYLESEYQGKRWQSLRS